MNKQFQHKLCRNRLSLDKQNRLITRTKQAGKDEDRRIISLAKQELRKIQETIDGEKEGLYKKGEEINKKQQNY